MHIVCLWLRFSSQSSDQNVVCRMKSGTQFYILLFTKEHANIYKYTVCNENVQEKI